MTQVLCVNGWAQPPEGLQGLAPDALHLDYRSCRNFTESSALIAERLPEASYAIGWSLGGTILMHAIASGALRTKQLVLIAPPLQFVAREPFVHAMDPLTFQLFYDNYRQQPERTAARFNALIAKGDSQGKRIMQELGTWEGSHDADTWYGWLDKLNEQSFDDLNYSILPKTLILHGEKDAIVSIEQSRWMEAHYSQVTLHRWSEVGHAPHLHDMAGARAAIDTHAHQFALR